ncbi:toxin-antitoxin system YwqK family antitoxin [Stutzerimonas chloritidismutans]
MYFSYRRSLILSALSLASLSLTGCFTEEIDARQTQEIQGLLYKVHAEDPFTGRVLNYPISVLGLYNVGSCSADIKNGLPDGEMRCVDNAGTVVATGEFKEGKRNGKEEKFDAETGNKTATAHWLNGLQDGVQEQFNPRNGKRILEVHYKAGKKAGRERAWDQGGNELIADLEWKNGLKSGFDNRGNQHRQYYNGKEHGLQKEFRIANNRSYIHIEENYENGLRHGVQKEIDAHGNVTELSVFEHGKLRNRTIDKYSNSGQHLHHYSTVALTEDPNPYSDSDMSRDGAEYYWDDNGRLVRELQWSNGKLLSATATVWVGDSQDSQYQGVVEHNYGNQQFVVKHGQERLFSDKGELQAVIFWDSGNAIQTFAALPADQRSQFPGKMGLVDGYHYGVTVRESSAFNEPSRYMGENHTRHFERLVDMPVAGQVSQASGAAISHHEAANSSDVNEESQSCVQRKIDDVHADNPDAWIRADMLQEFEQDCL